jgi:hypothetical protein
MRFSARGSVSSLLSITLLSLCLFALGCATGVQSTGSSSMPQLRGIVHGGSQPISGASIQLYAAGATGYGTGATALLKTSVTTDATGSFSITGDYTCPSSTSQVYLVATGGNPGLAPGTNNAAIVLMTALGPCTLYGNQYTLNPNSYVFINEATTVASVYALAPFMNPVTTQVGATSTNATGLANAFLSVQNLVNTATGIPLATTPAGNGTVPQAELDTLADILASCVNSNGVSTTCASLQAASTPAGGTAPTTILQGIYNIATNPASQVAALYALAAADAPFQPTLTTAPNDWTVALNYTGGGLSQPLGIAIDGTGNVWTASSYGNNTSVFAGVNEFNGATGAALSPASGYNGGGISGSNAPSNIAIDPFGNVWASGYGINSSGSLGIVAKFSSAGVPLSPSTGYDLPQATDAVAIAIEGSGNVWLADPDTSSLFELSGSTGAFLSPAAGYSSGGLNRPDAIAIDNSGNIWAANPNGNSVSLLNGGTGAAISPSTGYTGGGLNQPNAIAIDNSGNIWVSDGALFNQFGQILNYGSISELNGATGAAISPSSGYTGGGSLTPVHIAVDGIGNVWIVNSLGAPGCSPPFHLNCPTLTELNGSTGGVISGPNRYTSSSLYNTSAIAIDGAGNIWLSNANPASLTEFVGAAAPVVTPLATAVANHSIATRP